MNEVLFALLGYLLLFVFVSVGVYILRIRNRKDKTPIEFKPLNGPGESLRRRLAKFEEDFIMFIGGWAIVPIVAGGAPVMAWIKFFPPQTWPQLYALTVVAILLFAFSTLFAMRKVWAGLQRNRSDRLGYLGERYVGEMLQSLNRDGFHIFHDIPAEGTEKKFNLDHVVVGSTGVWLIETKTRRKGHARPGFKSHEVTFDGQQLIWPWGEDSHGVQQTINETRWLNNWVKVRTGLNVEVRGVLTLPGWMVIERARGAIRVLNSKNLPSTIRSRGETILTSDQIDYIARQLDLACRVVAD